MTKTNAVKFADGTSRSHRAPHYELAPKKAIDRLVKRMELGAKIHGKFNWRTAGPEYIEETKRHLLEHALNYINGDKSDDHLGAILANAAILADLEEQSGAPIIVNWDIKQNE